VALTNDAALAARMARLRSHGIARDAGSLEGKGEGAWYYEVQELGWNYRMTDIAAALGLSQLQRLDDNLARRTALAQRYDRLLADCGLTLPRCEPDCASAWHLYVIGWNETRGGSRAEAFQKLRAAGIGVQVHYIPLHLHPLFRKQGFKPGQYPNAEAHYARAISIPLYATLHEAEQDRVVECLRRLAA
jgi:dTDP-4-amino-4,6-dideoxygalactose transaminase